QPSMPRAAVQSKVRLVGSGTAEALIAMPFGPSRPEAKVLTVPPGVNSVIVPPEFAMYKLPAESKAMFAGLFRPVRMVLEELPGVNFNTVPEVLPKPLASETQRLPEESNTKSSSVPSPDAKVLEEPPGVNLTTVPLN